MYPTNLYLKRCGASTLKKDCIHICPNLFFSTKKVCVAFNFLINHKKFSELIKIMKNPLFFVIFQLFMIKNNSINRIVKGVDILNNKQPLKVK